LCTPACLARNDEHWLAQAEAERRVKTRGTLGDIKIARAVASKLRAPDTDLVRMDLQRWPKNFLHTKAS